MNELSNTKTALYSLKLAIIGKKGKGEILRATISQKLADVYDIAGGDILDVDVTSHRKEGRDPQAAERVR